MPYSVFFYFFTPYDAQASSACGALIFIYMYKVIRMEEVVHVFKYYSFINFTNTTTMKLAYSLMAVQQDLSYIKA